MNGRYIHLRFPVSAYPFLKQKQLKITQELQNKYPRKKICVPITKVLRAISENESIIDDRYLQKMFMEKK